MIRRFRLAAVLRAREAQEDVAKGAVVRARRDASAAAQFVRRQAEALGEHPLPRDGTGGAVVAAITARQSLAAALAESIQVASHAQDRIEHTLDELVGASARRRSVEKLAERHAATLRHSDLAADQKTGDEHATNHSTRQSSQQVQP